MGQTISLHSCVTGGSVIRVMKTDGEFAVFDFPCVSAEVMMQHPGHLVLHCSPVNRNTIGQRSKITIMLPDQPLLPGQPYMLYPIPEQYKKTLSKSKSFSMLKKKLESPNPQQVTPEVKRQGRRKALKLIVTRLHLATFVAQKINEKEVVASPLLEAAPSSSSSSTTDAEEEVKLPKPSDLNYTWRPMLSSIPESPLGFHSRPESPLGLYKMDKVPPSVFPMARLTRSTAIAV